MSLEVFAGATMFLLGGGPSLGAVDLERLRGRKIIGINASAKRCPWADVLFFHDYPWFAGNRELVLRWAGLVATNCQDAAAGELPKSVLRFTVEKEGPLRAGATALRWARSSGQMAIALAIALGAARIVLLGYDMRLVDGRSHFHDDYAEKRGDLYAQSFIPAFAGWNLLALEAGCIVVNATPGSALTEFRMTTLEEELARA